MYKLLTVLFLLSTIFCYCQKKTNNYTFIKLCVFNEKNQILLVEWGDKWEILGKKYNDTVSLSKEIKNIGRDIGLTDYTETKLHGLFTYHYSTRPNPTIMQYYSVKYISGDLRVPPGCTNISWFDIEEAYKIIPYMDMEIILRQILKQPNKVLGGAVKKSKSTTNKDISKFIEPIYILN